jgi:hypothetical protein
VEFTMTSHVPAVCADLREILLAPVNDVFPVAILKRLLDQMETRP